MSFLAKLFSYKAKNESVKENTQTAKPRYVVLKNKDDEDDIPSTSISYRILDTKENMKLGLTVSHDIYDSGCVEHNDCPNPDKNGVYVRAEVVVGDFYEFPGDEGVMSFTRNAKALDKDLKRTANNDDADFALYTSIQNEINGGKHREQAVLLHTLLKVVKSDILSSPNRVTEEYREQQKAQKQAEMAEKYKNLQEEKRKYQKEQVRNASKHELKIMKKRARISDYLNGYDK